MKTNNLCELIIKRAKAPITIFTKKSVQSKRNKRECWAIIHKFEGETVYKTEKGEYISNFDNMVILPKGSSYEWVCAKAGFYSIIEFECDTEITDIFTFPIREPEYFRKTFKELERKSLSGDPFYGMECIKSVYSMILRLVGAKNQSYQPKSKNEKIKIALDYIAAKYYAEIDNDYLASLCGMSTVYFRKLFTELVGCSPITYIHKIRMEKAKEMLRMEKCKISDVALTVGYSSIYHFSKMFKQYVGISPREFAAKNIKV